MGNSDNLSSTLEQELTRKVSELEMQRSMREQQLVSLTLRRIADGIKSKEQDIITLMTTYKGQCGNGLREIVVKEILRSADGLLWCREYVEKLRSDQRMSAYTGTHWETIEPQQWKDFVSLCAERCGIPESQRMNHTFMTVLHEGVAFNLAEYRHPMIPDNEVWLNVRNGTLVVKSDGSVTLRDHRKEDLFTYTLPYAYIPQATCPLWHKFLDRILPEVESQQVLAEFIGYSIMKHHLLEKMLWFYGDGQNGKSVTLEIVERLLGSENVSYLSLSDLTNDEVKRSAIEHKMLNISHESGKDVNPSVLKQLTSGERVLIKYLYRDPYETRDYGKFVAAFNVLPKAEVTGGYFRRLIILPYEVTIPDEEKDEHLTEKLLDELSGILNWVLQALPGLMKRGRFTESESCTRALNRYRLQSDSVRLFVNEMCKSSDYTTAGDDLFKAYREYCISSSLKPLGKIKFFERLEKIGHSREKYGHLTLFRLKLMEQ